MKYCGYVWIHSSKKMLSNRLNFPTSFLLWLLPWLASKFTYNYSIATIIFSFYFSVTNNKEIWTVTYYGMMGQLQFPCVQMRVSTRTHIFDYIVCFVLLYIFASLFAQLFHTIFFYFHSSQNSSKTTITKSGTNATFERKKLERKQYIVKIILNLLIRYYEYCVYNYQKGFCCWISWLWYLI